MALLLSAQGELMPVALKKMVLGGMLEVPHIHQLHTQFNTWTPHQVRQQ